jgi:hypothetical protein
MEIKLLVPQNEQNVLAQQLLAAQERLSSVELVTVDICIHGDTPI